MSAVGRIGPDVDEPAGRTRQQGAAHVDVMQAPAYPAMGVAAKGIIQRDDGTVLLIRRSPRSGAYPGMWDLPGGKMDYGEELTETLVREVREETGLRITGARPFHVSHFVKPPFWVTCVTYVCSPAEGQVRLSSEHVEHVWVSLRDLDGRTYAGAIREQLDAFAALSDGEMATATLARSGRAG
jgi:8-oxo-dGTP diphosphatase